MRCESEGSIEYGESACMHAVSGACMHAVISMHAVINMRCSACTDKHQRVHQHRIEQRRCDTPPEARWAIGAQHAECAFKAAQGALLPRSLEAYFDTV